nr:MAG TPA: putative tail component [Caudoviricetes sp.]
MDFETGELRRLAVNLGAAGREATQKAQAVVAKAAFDVEARAKSLAPVDTGALRNSIGTDLGGDRLSAVIGPTAAYGIYLELGTRRMAPQPYMGPALDAVEPGFVAAMEQLGGDVL